MVDAAPAPSPPPASGGPAAAGLPAPPTGYTIVLPPAWRRIPVRRGTDEAVTGILDQVFGRAGSHSSPGRARPLRTQLQRWLLEAAGQARRSGAIDLYLPVEPVHGTLVAASFVVAELSPGQGANALAGLGEAAGFDAPAVVTAQLLAVHEGATLVSVDGVTAVRVERTAGPEPAQQPGVPSRRVDYMIPVPGGDGRWLVAAFSTPGAEATDDRYAGVLVALFDAMMSTLRWKRS